MLVPWPPGGASDLQMRAVSDQASRRLGKPLVIENKPGALGSLGAQHMAQEARPDGYTIGQMPVGVFRMAAMADRPAYDPLRDFTWIIRLVGYMGGIVVRADAPWQSFPELVEYARANPNRLAFGTPTAQDTVMSRVARMTGVEWTHAPFRGAAPNLQALLSGDIQFSVETSAWADMVLEGRLRLLAVYTSERAARFPNVPTLREVGFDVVAESTYGVAGPRGMDPEVIQILHDAFKGALYDPAHLAVLARLDMPLRYLNTADYTASIPAEVEDAKEITRELGLRMG
jgi:tripartite-type tricarboxylate transporter receptor subunit TctC